MEREKTCEKISEDEFTEEFILFKKNNILEWAQEIGPSFFEENKKSISADEADSLDSIVHVRNSILRPVLSKIDFHKIYHLLKAASEPARDKILSISYAGR